MYIYYTMTPRTTHQVEHTHGSTPLSPSQNLTRDASREQSRATTTIQRDQCADAKNLPSESSLPVPELPIILQYLQSLPAELLQLLNLPVVPQLGGEGASLGPTRQLRAHTWRVYIRSLLLLSVSLSQTSINIHSLTHCYLCFTDDSLVDVYLLYGGSGDQRHRIQRRSREPVTCT